MAAAEFGWHREAVLLVEAQRSLVAKRPAVAPRLSARAAALMVRRRLASALTGHSCDRNLRRASREIHNSDTFLLLLLGHPFPTSLFMVWAVTLERRDVVPMLLLRKSLDVNDCCPNLEGLLCAASVIFVTLW